MTTPILQMKILGQPALGPPAESEGKEPWPPVSGTYTLTTTLCSLCAQGL